jgi:hypothetical protein
MKVLHLALMATFSVVYATVAVAIPITYYGQKGEYTVDYEAGTYRGCVYGTGCIKLGRNRKAGISTWKNGDYTYSINDDTVEVYLKGKLIFKDTFN